MAEMQIPLIKGDKVDDTTDYRDALPVNMSGVVKPILGAQGYMLQQPGLTEYGVAEIIVEEEYTIFGP